MRGLSPVAASGGHSSSRCAGLFTIAASFVAEHRLQTRRLSSCGSRAQPLRGMWDLPRPGLERVSPALAGRLPTTAPPGKPLVFTINAQFSSVFFSGGVSSPAFLGPYFCTLASLLQPQSLPLEDVSCTAALQAHFLWYSPFALLIRESPFSPAHWSFLPLVSRLL